MRDCQRRGVSGWVVLLFGLLPAGAAFGVDGVVEINQARAIAGGLTPGDAAKFPVTIDRSGSYRLTSNLDLTDANARPNGVAAENTTAILVTAANVTIDLNGFSILGATVCSGQPVNNCAPSGSGKGIDGSAQSGITVVNGTVRGMGSDGVALGMSAMVERVRAISNGKNGIEVDTPGRVASSEGTSNGARGISYALVVTDCAAIFNQELGIGGGAVSNSVANVNRGFGILASVAIGCWAMGNDGGVGVQISAPGVLGLNICGAPCRVPDRP
jgi:hypothetical protein